MDDYLDDFDRLSLDDDDIPVAASTTRYHVRGQHENSASRFQPESYGHKFGRRGISGRPRTDEAKALERHAPVTRHEVGFQDGMARQAQSRGRRNKSLGRDSYQALGGRTGSAESEIDPEIGFSGRRGRENDGRRGPRGGRCPSQDRTDRLQMHRKPVNADVGEAAYRSDRGGHGRRGRGNRRDEHGNRKPWVAFMGYKRLLELTQNDSDERTLCLTLISETSGLNQLLNDTHIKSDWMKLLLEIIAKASRSTARPYVLQLLNKVSQSPFLEHHLNIGYLLRMSHETNPQRQIAFVRSIEHILEILEAILCSLPNFSDKCQAVLIILETITPKLEHVPYDEKTLLQFKITALNERANDIQSVKVRQSTPPVRRESRHREVDDTFENVQPPDDFRELSICPTYDDIHTQAKPYIRANKDKGGYDSVDHYLDVQFRLLREDYVRPLREGIAEHLENVKAGKPEAKLSDMRLYQRVQIICPMCTSDGIAYRIQFDNSKLQNVRWQASKRLIYGSLLCLSSDNFKTLLFATVTGRDVKDLAEGFLDIRFVERFTLDKNTPQDFVMAETTAYFEAYRHVLAGLQELTAELPFENYIVSCQTDVRPPHYLRRDAPRVYDLSCFVREDASRSEKLKAKAVPVLTTSRWPDIDSLCFDDSQLKAVKTALTKEFTIIQGPPGTGKTYVGLKIVRTLLENGDAWGSHKPILIVCYTNHALDQFLEGMLDFEVSGLLRIGGRSASERLAKFNIKSKKEEMKKNKTQRRDIMDGARDCRREMRDLHESIDSTSAKLEVSARGILHEKALRDYMTDDQFYSLSVEDRDYTSHRKQSVMPLWLDVGVDLYGGLEGFGESHLYALTPDHIAGLVFRLRKDQQGDFDAIDELENSQNELEDSLRAAVKDGQSLSKPRFPLADQWNMYSQFHTRFQNHQMFELRRVQKEVNQAERRINNAPKHGKSRDKRGSNRGNESLLKELQKLNEKASGVKDTLAMLQNNLGILRASMLVTIMTPEEKVQFGFNNEPFDDLIFPKWLGYRNIIETLTREMEPREKDDDEPEDAEELIDVEEEAEMLGAQRMVEGDEDLMPMAQAVKQQRELATRIAAQELSVNLNRVNSTAPAGEWQMKMPNKRKLKQRVRQIIQNAEKMSREEAERVTNVWHLNARDKGRLYTYWLSLYREELKTSIEALSVRYDEVADRLKEIREDEDYHIMKEAKVLGMTTTGAAKFRHVLQRLKPPIIVVEEAAEVLESHIISALNPSCEHLILIGDHKQLRPSPAVYDLAKHYNLELSLFERMVNNDVRCDTLALQHRMRPEIADLMKFIYPNLENDDSVLHLDQVRGVSCNLFFIDHQKEEVRHEENKSRSNTHEARFLAAFCRYLLLQGYDPSQITVLTTYSGQVFELKKAMPKKSFEGVRVTAVDNYQGEENDIILLSLVRSNTVGSIGFLSIENRVCVALSRAKKGLFVIGNFSLLSQKNTLWHDMVSLLKSRDGCGKELELYCQNHPELERIRVSTEKDFAGAPEGGCMRPCESRLECGHQCQKPCHILDPDHENYVCQKPCAKECSAGHRCKKLCYKACGDCTVISQKIVPMCGHKQKVPCYQDPATVICKAECSNFLSCGHQCAEKCGTAHTKVCRVEVRRLWPCGHMVKTACHNQPSNFPCREPCSAILDCGHPCKGSCSKCLQGRLHEGCSHRCGRSLVCGHECLQPCTKSCPPCMSPCGNRCVHSRCDKRCGEACAKCREPCQWTCKHLKCTKMCGEICDRPPCDKPCKMRLPCGHSCIGLCGEECPELCRVCDKDQVTEVFFGTEEDRNARFILLEDCGHIIEVTGMDQWMALSENNDSGQTDVQLKGCPKCKVTIRKSLRYGNFVKKVLRDVEKVKNQIRGSSAVILRDTLRLKQNIWKSILSDSISLQLEERLNASSLSLQQLNVLENQIELLKHGCELSAKLLSETSAGNLDKGQTEEMVESMNLVQHRILTWQNFVSDQQLREAKNEMLRLSYLFKAQLFSHKLTKQAGCPAHVLSDIQKAIQKLISAKPFNDSMENEMTRLMRAWKRIAPLGISEDERAMVVKAMELNQGHWFKCPNGHVYAIGECGGAMEEGVCPECREKIGGTRHKLVSDNTLAREMDGARFAAWSEQANMENFDLDDGEF